MKPRSKKPPAKIGDLRAEIKRLRKALNMMTEPSCYDLHHKKGHEHGYDEECPAVAEYKELTK